MLDDMNYIIKVDQYEMRNILQEFPDQCKEAIKIGEEVGISSHLREKEVKKVLVCGLGGSAIGGEILKNLFSKTKILFIINRDYHLPSSIDKETVTFIVSYSGNTEETISAFEEALKIGCPIFSISSGGKLQKLSEEYKVPHIKVPGGMPPRCAVGYLTLPMVRILEKILGENLFDYKELEKILSEISKSYLPDKKTAKNLAKQTANELLGKIPLIYGVNNLTDVVAHRLKTQFNENSKVFAFWDVVPELNHNEVVPWLGEGKVDLKIFYPIFIRDREEGKKISRRMEVTQELIKKNKIGYSEIWTEGKCILSRIFSSIYIGDWISFYLAILQEVDPTPVRAIDFLKKELSKV